MQLNAVGMRQVGCASEMSKASLYTEVVTRYAASITWRNARTAERFSRKLIQAASC